MSTQSENAASAKGTVYSRKSASLPPSLLSITVNNVMEKLVLVEELDPNMNSTDRGPHIVATTIKVIEVKDGVEEEVHYDLVNTLTLDQLRKFCGQLNCGGYASATKYKCRRMIAACGRSAVLYNPESNPDSAIAISKKLNSDLRKVNTFFHKEMFEQVCSINRLMKRADHEDGTTEKETYIALAELYNSDVPNIALDLLDCEMEAEIEPHLLTNTAFIAADLMKFTPTTSDGKPFKKFIKEMFALRKYMKELMHNQSGEHRNDPMYFVDLPIKKMKFPIHRLALYYFFIKCEDHSRIDEEFQPAMSHELKGSSDLVAPLTASVSSKSKKHSNVEAMETAQGLKSIVAVLTAKEQRDAQREARKEKEETRKAEAKEQREKRKEQLKLLKSGVFSPDSSKKIKDDIIAGLGIKKRKINSSSSSSSSSSKSDSE